jgi:hypothetical protein
MPNDLIRLAMDQAIQDHGSQNGEFTARRFAEVLARITSVTEIVHPSITRAIMSGRSDCELLPGGKFRLVP